MSRPPHLEIDFLSTPVHCDVVCADATGSWYLIDCKPLKGKLRKLDALKVRDEFLQVRNDAELMAFLQQTGRFHHKEFLIQDLRNWQELVKALISTPPTMWAKTLQGSDKRLVEAALARRNLSVHLPFDGEGSLPAIQVFSTLEAIMASILTDHLHGVRHAICSREDCAKLFQVQNLRARLFCSQYCGHLVSLRKTRNTNASGSKRKTPNGSTRASTV